MSRVASIHGISERGCDAGLPVRPGRPVSAVAEGAIALYLHEVEGYRFSEIAAMFGCSEAAAKKAASRARRRLAVELSPEGNA